jgi:hypothetical protein
MGKVPLMEYQVVLCFILPSVGSESVVSINAFVQI